MKVFLSFVLLLFSMLNVFGQVIKGSVVNDASQRISGVSVYIDGTKIATSSSQDGSFQLDVLGQKNAILVFKKDDYESVSVKASDYFDKSLKVVLNKVSEIEEVVIIPYTEEAYRNYINYFLSAFIGENQNDVKIKNVRSLKFSYDKQKKFLQVKAPKTLIIENKKLGYEIQYNLINFSVDFNSKIQKFSGTSFFKETKNSGQTKINRMNAYNGSLMHFLRSLYLEKTREEAFEINKIIKIPNPKYPTKAELEKLADFRKMIKQNNTIKLPEDVMDIAKRSKESQFVLALVERDLADSKILEISNGQKYLTFPDILQVKFSKYFYEKKGSGFVKSQLPISQSSYMYVEGQSFEIYPDGNCSSPDDLLTDGDFGRNKIENLLPLDYKFGE
ncbi:carboxypeptidase-like regulatory domain-containing protein [Soonwooa sp.]|uniref:carboxypeptidase-like regulatory domain-containing protein n=1 Tax=Soonwooa sp. TaxID=1938592 RepID=UPI00262EF17C|nr:carboxypeptidase-like regulatory domain-containing protein [Soonwooa sp.]